MLLSVICNTPDIFHQLEEAQKITYETKPDRQDLFPYDQNKQTNSTKSKPNIYKANADNF